MDVIGFAGVIVINVVPGAWGSGFSFQGEGISLLCAITYGISSVTMKLISHRESPMTITAFQLLFGGAVLMIAGYLTGGSMYGFNARSSALFFYLVLLSTIAFTLWAELLKYNPVGKVTIFGFSIPVFGVTLSALLLGEDIFTVQNLAALVLVSIGIVVVNSAPCKMRSDNVQ